MAVDKKKINLNDKIKSFNLKNTFNTIANLSQDLRDEAYKLDLVRAKSSANKKVVPHALLGAGALSAGTYWLFNRMNLNPGLVHMISSVILVGLGLKLKYITSPFGKLIEKPLKFNLIDLNTGQTLTRAELIKLNAELPDPIKFYELGDSSFKFKISNPNLSNTKNGVSEFVNKETKNVGDKDNPVEEHIYTWNNQRSSEYALEFDEESQKTIREIVRIYEQPKFKEMLVRFWPLLATGAVAGGLAALESNVKKGLQPKKNQPAVPVTIQSDPADLIVPKRKTPSRHQLIERLKK